MQEVCTYVFIQFRFFRSRLPKDGGFAVDAYASHAEHHLQIDLLPLSR
jgi:hypothetical protein